MRGTNNSASCSASVTSVPVALPSPAVLLAALPSPAVLLAVLLPALLVDRTNSQTTTIVTAMDIAKPTTLQDNITNWLACFLFADCLVWLLAEAFSSLIVMSDTHPTRGLC
jgi:hypothetical protein